MLPRTIPLRVPVAQPPGIMLTHLSVGPPSGGPTIGPLLRAQEYRSSMYPSISSRDFPEVSGMILISTNPMTTFSTP